MKMYTCREFAELFDISRQMVYLLKKQNRIKTVEIENVLYVPEEEINNVPYSWKRRRVEKQECK